MVHETNGLPFLKMVIFHGYVYIHGIYVYVYVYRYIYIHNVGTLDS